MSTKTPDTDTGTGTGTYTDTFHIENDTMQSDIKCPNDRKTEFLTMVNYSKKFKDPSEQYNYVVGKAEEMGLDFKESYIEHDW